MEHIENQLDAYFDGCLDVLEQFRLEAHLKGGILAVSPKWPHHPAFPDVFADVGPCIHIHGPGV